MTTLVVAAAVIEQNDAFLMTRRQTGHLAGYWEFPGGKCEAGENHSEGLAREIREELGVAVTVGEEILSTTHEYPDRRVELHFLRCDLRGQPIPLLGQEMQWVPRHALSRLLLPPADDELIRLLIGLSS